MVVIVSKSMYKRGFELEYGSKMDHFLYSINKNQIFQKCKKILAFCCANIEAVDTIQRDMI